MAKYRKKPVVIDAIQYAFDGATIGMDQAQDAVADFMECNVCTVGDQIQIGTLEGVMLASPGDWIIKGVKGEFYPCKPDIFAATYEPAAALQQAQQPGAQAVAFGHVFRVHTENLSPDRPWTTTHGMPFDLGPAPFDGVRGNLQYLNLYTAPPPLPEGVSEEDAEAATMAYAELAVKYGHSNDVRTVGVDPECIRAALESYRARLAAKGGV